LLLTYCNNFTCSSATDRPPADPQRHFFDKRVTYIWMCVYCCMCVLLSHSVFFLLHVRTPIDVCADAKKIYLYIYTVWWFFFITPTEILNGFHCVEVITEEKRNGSCGRFYSNALIKRCVSDFDRKIFVSYGPLPNRTTINWKKPSSPYTSNSNVEQTDCFENARSFCILYVIPFTTVTWTSGETEIARWRCLVYWISGKASHQIQILMDFFGF